jgi:hypothetical protein
MEQNRRNIDFVYFVLIQEYLLPVCYSCYLVTRAKYKEKKVKEEWESQECPRNEPEEQHGSVLHVVFWKDTTLKKFDSFSFLKKAVVNWLQDERLKCQSSNPGRAKNAVFAISSRPALGPTQSPIQWILSGVKR